MICGKCETLGLARGIKAIKCTSCGRSTSNYSNGADLCSICSDQYNICLICGAEFSKPYDASWVVHVNIQGE